MAKKKSTKTKSPVKPQAPEQNSARRNTDELMARVKVALPDVHAHLEQMRDRVRRTKSRSETL